MNKLFSIEVVAESFLGPNKGDEAAYEEEANKVKEYFGIESLSEKVTITLKLENFLWYLFTRLPVPTAPLKVKAHDKYLADVAAKLAVTVDDKDAPVKLERSDLNRIDTFLLEDERFATLDAAPFEAIKVGSSNPEDIKPLRLPAINIYKDPSFIETLCSVFEKETDDGPE